MLKAFSYTGRPNSSVLGKELMEFYRPGKADNSSINSMRDQCCKFWEDSKGIHYKVPASRSLKYNREKTHFANIERWEDKNIWGHTKTFYDESSASTWELSGKELLRGGGEIEGTWKGEEEISSIQIRNCPGLVLVRPISIFFSK